MATYGRFEILEELNRTALGWVAIARVAGDVVGARFAIKVFDPSRMGLLESDAATQSFLDRAGLQRFLSQHGAQHWAPLHDLRPTNDGAYYVTDYYPLTAQKLLDAGTELTPSALHALVSAVVAGLLELKVARRRGHGNLKPGNILLAGTGNLEQGRVFLADPAVEGATAKARTADLRAVGRLIYHLVARAPFNEDRGWPIQESPEWARLGANGNAWRDLCNWLLDPSPAGRAPDLDSLAVAVRSLAGRRGRRVPLPSRKVLVRVGLPIILALGVVGMLSRLSADLRAQLQQANREWFAKFDASLSDPRRLQNYRADPALASVVNMVEAAKADDLPLDGRRGTGLAGLNPLTYVRTRRAQAAVHRVAETLSPAQWPRLGEAAELLHRYESRRWDEPAAYLAERLSAVRPGPGADVAAGIDRFLAVQPLLARDAPAFEQAWAQLDTDLRAAEAPGDKVILALAGAARRAAGSHVQLTDDGFRGLAEFQAMLPQAAQLAGVVRAGWPGTHARERLAADIESQLNLAAPGPDDLRKWLDNVDAYALVPLPEDAGPLASLNPAYKKLVDDVARQPLTPEERQAFETARAALAQKLEALRGAKFARKDVLNGQGDVAARWKSIQGELDMLRKSWVRLDDPKEWFAYVDQPLATTSDQLKQRWKAYVAVVRARLDNLVASPETFKVTKKTTEEVKAALARLDERFPPIPLGLREANQALANVAWDRREQELVKLTAWLEVKPDSMEQPAVPGPTTMDATANAYNAWCAKLRDLARDFPITKELLTAADRPDEKWRTADPAFWADPPIQAFVAPDLKRIGAVQAVNAAPRAEVIRLAADSNVPEIVLAAWRRLGQVDPPWPTQKGELDAEVGLRAKLTALLKGVKNAAERAAPEQELAAQAVVRWLRFTDAATAETVADSARLRGPLGVTDADLPKLAPAARFNLAVYGARAATGDANDAALRAAVAELTRAAEPLKDRPDVADLLARLGRVFGAEPMAGRKMTDTYTLPIQNSPFAVQFARVAPPGMRPFYLSRTEISIGVFIDLVNAYGTWGEAHRVLGTEAGVARQGPQAWYAPNPSGQPILRYDAWHFGPGERGQFDFEPSLRQTRFNRHSLGEKFGGNPLYEHPMQQLPAPAALYAAGLANCRLPTVREWQAAFEIERERTSQNEWNLRDQAWQLQQDYLPAGGGAQWPDNDMAGVFYPRGLRPAGSASRARDASDGTVLFRTVGAPGGSTFLQLVGNVAEFTCDAADVFDGWEEKLSADGLAAFLKAAGGRVSIIGGSALSAPELDPTRPYPPNALTEPYADVGFRLAFTAPARSLAERLKWTLDEQPYLAVGATTKAAGE